MTDASEPTAMVSMTTSLPGWLADRVHEDMERDERNQSGQIRWIIKRYYELVEGQMKPAEPVPPEDWPTLPTRGPWTRAPGFGGVVPPAERDT